jgi:hypothetical protein
MINRYVTLRYTPEISRVNIRELYGAAELSVQDASAHSVLRLLSQLIIDTGQEVPSKNIVTADRDAILATIYLNTYGSKIASTVHCQACTSKFDLDFSLPDLQTHLLQQADLMTFASEQLGVYVLDNVCRFRLPNGDDELSIEGLLQGTARTALLNRCILEGDRNIDADQIEQAMQQIAPILQTEMDARCPECGQNTLVQFDIQSFLIGRIINERKLTAWEIHCIANAYHWQHDDILQLPRSLRKMYVQYIAQK